MADSPYLRFRRFELPLRPRWRSWAFFLVVSIPVVFLVVQAGRAAFVSILGESVEPRNLDKALVLDPDNAELHHRLGIVLADSLNEADRSDGIKHLRRATELNPHAARYYSDLASACELDGDTVCATDGVEKAAQLSPMTPQLHWVAANTLLRAGQTEAALAEFRRLLELDPAYGPATFHLCLGALRDPQNILEKVLPAGKDPRLRLAYLSLLTVEGSPDLARQVWAQAVQAGTPFPLPFAAPYIEQLLKLGHVEDAQSAWLDLEKLGVVSVPAPIDPANLVFNGDFELTPLNAGFDWRSQSGSYVALDFSDSAAHTGNRCLRMDFTVSRNEEYTPLYQLVPVIPSRAYTLTAYVRSHDITSDSGPRLHVVDPVHPHSTYAMSETTVGTTPWHPIRVEFCTGSDTNLVQLGVTRQRGRTFPTEITGSFWLDTVVLEPASGVQVVCPSAGH
jgi:hypothetical protein